MRTTAMELGHEQPETPTQVDNTTTFNYAHGTLQQKRSKSFDMRLHWLRDRTNREQFYVCWAKGDTNMADYYSKHHTAAHEKRIRHKHLCSLSINKHLQHATNHVFKLQQSANMKHTSQQPLSATRGVLLQRGL